MTRVCAKIALIAGLSFFDMDRVELHSRYSAVEEESAKPLWEELHESSLTMCNHGSTCPQGDACTVGKRITTVRSACCRSACARTINRHHAKCIIMACAATCRCTSPAALNCMVTSW